MIIKRVIAPFLGDELFAYNIDGIDYYLWPHEGENYEDEDASNLLEEIDSGKINIRHVKYINPLTLQLLDKRPSEDKRYDLAISFEGLMRRLGSEEEQGI